MNFLEKIIGIVVTEIMRGFELEVFFNFECRASGHVPLHCARNKRRSPDEFSGGTITVSNLGAYGIDNFDAIINPPHAAILAVGAGAKKPVVGDDGELKVATVMSTTLSVDHRVIDGALGANLLNAIKDNLENPMGMLA